MPTSPNSSPWTPESLSDLATGYWKSQALHAAIETGLFDALPATAPAACERCHISPRNGTLLLEALTAMGILRVSGGVYEVEPTARPFLTTISPLSLSAALRFNAAMYGLWARLPDAVRTGQPVTPPGAHLGSDPARTRGFVLAMHSRGLALLPPVAAAIDLTACRTMLDVGAGAGTLGRMLAERNPDLRVTLLDLPGVTDVARGLTEAHPAAGRITHIAADYLAETGLSALPADYDAVLHCGALHQHSPADAARLIERLTRLLTPTGRLIIVDLLADPDRAGPAFPLLFGLNMALVSPTSHLHSTTEVERHLASAGLTDIRQTAPEGCLYRLVSAARSC